MLYTIPNPIILHFSILLFYYYLAINDSKINKIKWILIAGIMCCTSEY